MYLFVSAVSLSNCSSVLSSNFGQIFFKIGEINCVSF